jgi:hypothetical protein
MIIHQREGGVQKIYSSHSSYDPLAYLLYHMHGTRGWTYNDTYHYKQNSTGDWVYTTKQVSCLEFYAYKAHMRGDIRSPDALEKDILLYGGPLMQQYWCDQWIKIEEQRLFWVKQNQKRLKAELYSGLADAVAANETRLAGKFIVLPSSIQNSPRGMFQEYQDGMAIVRSASPDLFITFTANPKWREITENLQPGQLVKDRPDLVSRVFQMKMKSESWQQTLPRKKMRKAHCSRFSPLQ